MKRLICFLLVLPVSSVWATPAQIPRANFEVIVPAPPFAPGPVTVQLVLYPSWPSGSMRVDITDNESNIYTGPPLYDLTYTNKDPITLDIDLNIPAFDTTMLSTFVDERGNFLGTGIDRYFVSDGSSVNVFDHDPRPVRDYVEEEAKRKRDSAFAVVDSIRGVQ
jgi:hypothetical protein